MSRISVGRYGNMLRRLFAVRDTSIVAGELSPFVQPTIDVLSERPELAFLSGELLVAHAVTVTPDAGQAAGVRFRLPSTARVIATLVYAEMISVAAAATNRITLGGVGDTALATNQVSSYVMDTRYMTSASGGLIRSPLLVSSATTYVTGGQQIYSGRTPTDTGLRLTGRELPIVMFAAANVDFSLVTIDVQLKVNAVFRLRGADQSEWWPGA